MITACRANSTGDAVNHSLVDYSSYAFSVLCLFFPGLVVRTVVVTVIVHVAGVAGVAYLLVPCSFAFGFFPFVFSFTFCAFFFFVILIAGVVLIFFTIAYTSFFRWCPFPFPCVSFLFFMLYSIDVSVFGLFTSTSVVWLCFPFIAIRCVLVSCVVRLWSCILALFIVGVVCVQFCFLCCCISRRSRIVTVFSCCSLFKCESV